MRQSWMLLFLLFGLVACTPPTTASPTPLTLTPPPIPTAPHPISSTSVALPLVAEYHDLPLVTRDPYLISPEVWLSCMAPTPWEEALLQSEHAGFSVRLYANEEAFTIFREGEGRDFPRGSVIVKEKLQTPDDTEPTALGMMIKREAGFDSNAGDWEFAYWNKDIGLIEGNEALSNCVQCHREQEATDWVFWEAEE